MRRLGWSFLAVALIAAAAALPLHGLGAHPGDAAQATTPKVVDITGGTKFHGVIVGTSAGLGPLPCDEKAKKLTKRLKDTWGSVGWGELGNAIVEPNATKDAVTKAVDDAKKAVQPGQEFLFFFCDHGSKDQRIFFDGAGSMTAADLAKLLSGFRASMTMTVILDVCFAGGFVPELLNISNDKGVQLDKEHLAVLMSSSACLPMFNAQFSQNVIDCLGKGKVTKTRHEETTKADANQDGITTSRELFDCANTNNVARQKPAYATGTGPPNHPSPTSTAPSTPPATPTATATPTQTATPTVTPTGTPGRT